jgi:ABC-type transport system involved in multi-copper enzyme maturation permease subunit
VNGVVRSEWLKVRRRGMMWVLLTLAPVVILILYGMMFAGTATADLKREDAAAWDARLSVPNLVTFGDAMVYRLVALFCIILAGSMTANEFGWRTITTFAAWTGDRRKLVAGKLIATAIVAALLIVLAWTAVVVAVLAITATDGRFEAKDLTLGLAGELLRGIVVTWLAAMVYAVLAVAIGVWTRSAAGAIAIPLGILLLEPLGAAALTALGGVADLAANFTLSHNIDALLAADGPIRGVDEDLSDYPPPLQGLAFLLMFSAVTAALAVRTLATRDIRE